jgi:Tol biopolymer transport system component
MTKPLLSCLLALAFVLPALADDKLKPTSMAVNTEADEDEPHVGDAGLTLYFGVTMKGKEVVKVARRRMAGAAWGKASLIDDYVGNKGDIRGVFAGSGRYPQYLFFAVKDRQSKNYDLFVAVKQDAGKAWTAPAPVGSGLNVNTAEDEAHPWLSADGKSLYFSRKTEDGWKVFVSTRSKSSGPQGWQEAKDAGLPAGYHHATLTPDGKKMYLQGPLEKGRWGLFVSTMAGKGWGKPEPLESLNGEGKTGDRSPSLSRDGKFLYFASDRPGGKGGLDLYLIETAKLAKKKTK